MVFQKPNPFPKSIYDNIAYGPRIHGIKNKKILDEIVEKSLRGAAIWDEVKDRSTSSSYFSRIRAKNRRADLESSTINARFAPMTAPIQTLKVTGLAKV